VIGEPNVPIVTIDGPSGAGKGTVARALAERLGWHLLDSGALYRLVGLAAMRAGIDLGDGGGLARLAATLNAEFSQNLGNPQVWLDGEDVSWPLRTEDCGEWASQVARQPPVREALLARQRAWASPPGLVADGRDMGTVVFPQAPLKLFLTASSEERAARRHKQLKEKGIGVSLRDLSRDIAARDRRDAERTVAPLRAAEDALVIDSTRMSVAEVVECALVRLRELGLAHELK
jgi:cytidylate kinase